MTSRRARLQLKPAVARFQLIDGNITRYPESHFLDLIVNDRSLRALAGPAAENLVTELNRPWLDGVPDVVDKLRGLRGSEDLLPGRVALLVCKVDGNLGCGQLTAALKVDDAEVIWSDFLWEDDHSEATAVEDLHESFVFARADYEDVFADAQDRLAAFPYDELAHDGRRLRWPWQWGWRVPRK